MWRRKRRVSAKSGLFYPGLFEKRPFFFLYYNILYTVGYVRLLGFHLLRPPTADILLCHEQKREQEKLREVNCLLKQASGHHVPWCSDISGSTNGGASDTKVGQYLKSSCQPSVFKRHYHLPNTRIEVGDIVTVLSGPPFCLYTSWVELLQGTKAIMCHQRKG